MDSSLYRENADPKGKGKGKDAEPRIENEGSPVDEEALAALRTEYLSYKSANYYEVKNNARQNQYFALNVQCAVASFPGVLDVFVDSKTQRVVVKLHLSDRDGNHGFKLFRSKGSLRRHQWKHLVVQVAPSSLEIFLDTVLDTRVSLADHGVWFRERKEDLQVPSGVEHFRHKNSLQQKHNGLLLGNVDRLVAKANFDQEKFDRVYAAYQSKSLLDRTNQEYFEETTQASACSK